MCRQCRHREPLYQYVPHPPPGNLSLYMDCRRRQRYQTSILTAPEFPQMKSISALAAALTLCGRHGTLIAAASIFIGLAVPPLAAAFRPYFGEAIVVMLTLAFLRVDPVELRRHWKQPGLIAAATVWTMLILPVVLGMLFLAFKLDQKMPGLYFMLVLQISAIGLMSSPALAALWSRRRTHARNTDRRNRGNSIYCQPFHSCLSGDGAGLSSRIWTQIVFDYRRLRPLCRPYSAHSGSPIY